MDLSPRGPAQIIFTFGVIPVVLAFLVTPGGLICNKKHNYHSCSHNSNYSTESKYISEYKEKRNLLRKLADTNRNKVLGNAERIRMYKMSDVADKPAEYAVTLKDLNRGIENYLNN